MTTDDEPTVEQIILDHELAMQNMRDIGDGIRDGLFIIAVFALFIWGCWVFA